MDLEFELIRCLAAVEVRHQSMETKVTEFKGVEPKVRTKTRLNAESYKIRKRLSFDNFDNIVILEKIKKVTFYYIINYCIVNYIDYKDNFCFKMYFKFILY